MKKILLGLAAILAVGAPLTLAATPAQAADDGQGNTFNVRESHVKVVGDRCAYIHYSVDGWSAGWDADYTMGSAFVTVHGAGIDEIEMYDWWDWSQTDWDSLTWSDEQQVCSKNDTTLTIRAEFDVYPDDYEYDDCYSTAVEETVTLDYQPVSLAATNQPNNLVVKVGKDGKAWGHVRVSVAGLTKATNGKGVVKFPKRDLPQGHVKVTVGTSPAYAALKARVS